MSTRPFKLTSEQIRPLATGHGGCIASDMITVDGFKVGYMYRDEPANPMDSGWRFLSGRETPEYMADASKHRVYDVNTIANYDRDIIAWLDAPIGSSFERTDPDGALTPIRDSP